MPTLRSESITEREEVDFRVLRALSADPKMSQRQLAKTVGVSLGAMNYCLKALAEKGLLKFQNFHASDKKLKYVYVLTPQGIGEKLRLASRFLERKRAEYERLKHEIAEVTRDFEEN